MKITSKIKQLKLLQKKMALLELLYKINYFQSHNLSDNK